MTVEIRVLRADVKDWEETAMETAKELAQTLAEVVEYRAALENASYDFSRISTANWTAEMMAVCAEASEGRILLILDKYSVEKE